MRMVASATGSAGVVGSMARSGRGTLAQIARQPYAREDLAALGQVPVAERGAGHAPVSCPRAAAKHAVALAEEYLRVLAVGVRDEAGVAAEAALRPLPHAPHLLEPRAPAGLARAERRGLLPLCLRRQARTL